MVLISQSGSGDSMRYRNLINLGDRVVSKSVDRDAYFTPAETAQKIVDFLLERHPEWREKEWYEPSAGSGNFIEAARARGISISGMDIHPLHPAVIQGDFLQEEVELTEKIVVGNPPYGYRSIEAIRFINRAFA